MISGQAGKECRQDFWLAGFVASYTYTGWSSWPAAEPEPYFQISILLRKRTEHWFYSCQVYRQMTFFSLWFNCQTGCCALKWTPSPLLLGTQPGHIHPYSWYPASENGPFPPSVCLQCPCYPSSHLPLGSASVVVSEHVWNAGAMCERRLIPKWLLGTEASNLHPTCSGYLIFLVFSDEDLEILSVRSWITLHSW